MDNNSWGQILAAEYRQKTGEKRAIRLPARDEIQFDGDHSCLTITMDEQAVIGNFQNNASAFEAWTLALKIWCEVGRIELQWEPPQDDRTNTERCHYQRFLYRVERFCSLFPDWFSVTRPELLAAAQALGDGPLILNLPGHRDPAARPPANGEKGGKLSEADLEKYLLCSTAFKRYFGLDKRDRQLPVGLFRHKVAQHNRIFTGGKSAIDLVGIGGDTLWLFELKAGKYIPAGIVSELLFYTSVLRDAVGHSPRFRFEQRQNSQGSKIYPDDIRRCTRIEAVFLGEQLHPLVGDPRVLGFLNESVVQNWNASQDHVPIVFSATILKRTPGSDDSFVKI